MEVKQPTACDEAVRISQMSEKTGRDETGSPLHWMCPSATETTWLFDRRSHTSRFSDALRHSRRTDDNEKERDDGERASELFDVDVRARLHNSNDAVEWSGTRYAHPTSRPSITEQKGEQKRRQTSMVMVGLQVYRVSAFSTNGRQQRCQPLLTSILCRNHHHQRSRIAMPRPKRHRHESKRMQ